MANTRSAEVLEMLREMYDNNHCFECGAVKPQWVSVSYGIWICQACAGLHHGLGVHLSVVRSVMGQWEDCELNKMKASGNQRARYFLEAQPDYKENWSLQEKYNSRAASLLKDKVLAESEGRGWSKATSSLRSYSSPFFSLHAYQSDSDHSSNSLKQVGITADGTAVYSSGGSIKGTQHKKGEYKGSAPPPPFNREMDNAQLVRVLQQKVKDAEEAIVDREVTAGHALWLHDVRTMEKDELSRENDELKKKVYDQAGTIRRLLKDHSTKGE